ncbi:MAG: hypothetical protein NZ919_03125 [Candidatus Caldarchaeum sp.]|nr:hypothetical protein [Candidatus Caldarchaeum sp.]
MRVLLSVAVLASLVFVYGDGGLPADPYFVIGPPPLGIGPEYAGNFTITGRGFSLNASRLVRGIYEVVAYWPDYGGVVVGTMAIAVSGENVAGVMVLALRDVSVKVVGRHGRNLEGAVVSVSPYLLREGELRTSPDGTTSFLRLPDGIVYQFKASWTSSYGRAAESTVIDTAASLQKRGSIVLPVDDVEIAVLDAEGRPVAGAEVLLDGFSIGLTDAFGKVVAASVPLGQEYKLTVLKDGSTIANERARLSHSKTSHTATAGIYDLTVFVMGEDGQPIHGASVELLKNGAVVAVSSTDASGKAVFTKIVGGEYSVKASYGNIAAAQTLSPGIKYATLKLDVFAVFMGVALNFQMTFILAAAAVLALITTAIAVYEILRWRSSHIRINQIKTRTKPQPS